MSSTYTNLLDDYSKAREGWHTFCTKRWFRIAAKGFLLTGVCFGSRWPIVPYVIAHFASCFVSTGKVNILKLVKVAFYVRLSRSILRVQRRPKKPSSRFRVFRSPAACLKFCPAWILDSWLCVKYSLVPYGITSQWEWTIRDLAYSSFRDRVSLPTLTSKVVRNGVHDQIHTSSRDLPSRRSQSSFSPRGHWFGSSLL